MEGCAETEGFEPSVELPLHTLSKRAPSATRTSLRLFLPGGKNTVSIFISRIFFQHWQLLQQLLHQLKHFLSTPVFQQYILNNCSRYVFL
jgi:hypothetical protein